MEGPGQPIGADLPAFGKPGFSFACSGLRRVSPAEVLYQSRSRYLWLLSADRECRAPPSRPRSSIAGSAAGSAGVGVAGMVTSAGTTRVTTTSSPPTLINFCLPGSARLRGPAGNLRACRQQDKDEGCQPVALVNAIVDAPSFMPASHANPCVARRQAIINCR